MKVYFKERIFLILLVIAFIAIKYQQLNLPYYWDESWPYAPAIIEMKQHGISLLPGAIQPELSRGHPLLFHAAAATWIQLFGNSLVAMHSFALFWSLLFLVILYEAALRLFGLKSAMLVALLTACQIIFFVQSSFVLFDMLVALLSFSALYCYHKEKYFWTTIILMAAFYLKESSLVAGCIIGLWAFSSLFYKSFTLKEKIIRCLPIAISGLAISLFFLLQKQTFGWYIFPLYNNLIEHDWAHFYYVFTVGVLKTTFEMDARYLLAFLLAAVSIAYAFRFKKFGMSLVLVPIAWVYIMLHYDLSDHHLRSKGLFVLFLIAVMLYLWQSAHLWKKEQRAFLQLLSFYMLAFSVFSALNFFSARYMLASIVPLMFIMGVFIVRLCDDLHPKLYWLMPISVIFIAFFSVQLDRGSVDVSLGAIDNIKMQQRAVLFMKQHIAPQTCIASGSFLQRVALTDTNAGYLKTKEVYKKMVWEINPQTNFVVFSSLEQDYRYQQLLAGGAYKLIYRDTTQSAWIEIYQRNH